MAHIDNVVAPHLLQGPRVRLRPWRSQDREPFAALNADEAVMEHFPSTLSREQSDATADRLQAEIEQRGWGFWAAEVDEGSGPVFIGFVGINVPAAPELPFQPCVEIGWRLARPYWGRGYASEGARLALRIGFEQLGLQEIVAMTQLRNQRSRAVMERLGMRESPGEVFDHPRVPVGSHARRMCLYRLSRQAWAQHAG